MLDVRVGDCIKPIFYPIFVHGVWVVNSANIFICVEWKRPVNAVYKSWMLWLLHEEFYILWSASMNVITWNCCIFSFQFKAVLWAQNCGQYRRRLLVLILLLKLRFDIVMWLTLFQKAVRSILNIAAVFTCDRWECKNPNLCRILCVESFWKWSAYITVWIKRRGSWILCIVF